MMRYFRGKAAKREKERGADSYRSNDGCERSVVDALSQTRVAPRHHVLLINILSYLLKTQLTTTNTTHHVTQQHMTISLHTFQAKSDIYNVIQF